MGWLQRQVSKHARRGRAISIEQRLGYAKLVARGIRRRTAKVGSGRGLASRATSRAHARGPAGHDDARAAVAGSRPSGFSAALD